MSLLLIITDYKSDYNKVQYIDMNKPTLTIIQGFIGVGKTTYSKALSRRTGAIRLNGDEYCDTHFTIKELETNWDECFSGAITQLWLEAEKLLCRGQSVILDFGFWDKESRDHARSVAQRLDVNFKHIYLNTDENIIMERLALRSGEIARRNLDNFKEFKENFEEPEDDEVHTII